MATTRVTRHIAASVFAAHAAVALSNARRDGHLEIALDSRDVIATAKGMLMAATDIAEEEAFTVLKRAPNRNHPCGVCDRRTQARAGIDEDDLIDLCDAAIGYGYIQTDPRPSSPVCSDPDAVLGAGAHRHRQLPRPRSRG